MLGIAFLFLGLGPGALLGFQIPFAPGLTAAHPYQPPFCVSSLLRKSSAIKEHSIGPGPAHGPFSGQPDGTSGAALLSHRGRGHTVLWEEPWCLGMAGAAPGGGLD